MKQIKTPNLFSGGISCVLTTKNEKLERIQDTDEMNQMLHNRNRKHFSQAQGTPCAMQPIVNEIGFGGNTKWCDKTLDKTATQNKTHDSSTREMLQECYAMQEQLPAEVPMEQMIQGFKKWKERTTTPPSGKHLGICHVLMQQYEKEREEKQENCKEKSNVATKAVQMQNMLINLAIKHQHTYERWETFHNNFLEKIAGKPLTEKLRITHMFESEWNCTLKYLIAKQLLRTANKGKTLCAKQAGRRPGRNAMDLAVQTTMVFEVSRMMALTTAKMFLDAKECHNRIIMSLSNIIC